jgi:hypothetical protein
VTPARLGGEAGQSSVDVAQDRLKGRIGVSPEIDQTPVIVGCLRPIASPFV